MTNQPQFEPLLSDVEAAALLGIHPKTLQGLARKGNIPAVHLGRYWRFRASALNEWIELHSTCQSVRVN
jgi:excisionase family DNA binding protein